MAHNVPAVILAAGASERLGQPKALAIFNGESLVKRAVRQLKESGCRTIVVVTNTELAVDIMLEIEEGSVVVNQNPEEGRTGTLQCGLLSLGGEKGNFPRKVLVVPVDRCGWTVETIDVLLQENKSCSPIPSGHPLLLCDSDIEDVLAATPDMPLRDLVNFVRIDAPGKFLNIDTPADLEAL
ncbi:MAG: NTP transferase domain-containing protein [Candidatus Poseidoniaceae archaeon]|nr:NTP transferase domain-containing protein [Candidatus Poseidoniaceae archaeon]